MRLSLLSASFVFLLTGSGVVQGQDVKAAAVSAAAEAANDTYYFELVRVVDANTVAVNIDLGFGVWLHNQDLDLQGLPNPAPLATETAEQKAPPGMVKPPKSCAATKTAPTRYAATAAPKRPSKKPRSPP